MGGEGRGRCCVGSTRRGHRAAGQGSARCGDGAGRGASLHRRRGQRRAARRVRALAGGLCRVVDRRPGHLDGRAGHPVRPFGAGLREPHAAGLRLLRAADHRQGRAHVALLLRGRAAGAWPVTDLVHRIRPSQASVRAAYPPGHAQDGGGPRRHAAAGLPCRRGAVRLPAGRGRPRPVPDRLLQADRRPDLSGDQQLRWWPERVGHPPRHARHVRDRRALQPARRAEADRVRGQPPARRDVDGDLPAGGRQPQLHLHHQRRRADLDAGRAPGLCPQRRQLQADLRLLRRAVLPRLAGVNPDRRRQPERVQPRRFVGRPDLAAQVPVRDDELVPVPLLPRASRQHLAVRHTGRPLREPQGADHVWQTGGPRRRLVAAARVRPTMAQDSHAALGTLDQAGEAT